MIKVDFSRRASDVARRLQPKPARQVSAAIIRLRLDPHPQDCKKLRGTDLLRVDVGEYRILYRVAKDEDAPVLHIEAIGKRNDDEVYRRQRRR